MLDLAEIEGLLDPKCSSAANLQHLIHVFEGYASAQEDSCPYAIDSLREFSWETGRKLREKK